MLLAPRLLGRDTQAAAEIVALAHELMWADDPAAHEDEYYALELAGTVLSSSRLCAETSDAATRAAWQLGIVATREYHDIHYITSFAPLDRMPSDDDPILCLTPGQFSQPWDSPRVPVKPYFGRRSDVRDLPVRWDAYAAESTAERQTAYCRREPASWPPREWLTTTPEQVVTGSYPVGEIEPDAYPDAMWR